MPMHPASEMIIARVESESSKRFARSIVPKDGLILIVDAGNPDCVEARRFLESKGYKIYVVDAETESGKELFERLPIDITLTPILITGTGDIYNGWGVIKYFIEGELA